MSRKVLSADQRKAEYRRVNGLCQRCSRKRTPGRSKCRIHLKYMRDYARRANQARQQAQGGVDDDINAAPWMVVC